MGVEANLDDFLPYDRDNPNTFRFDQIDGYDLESGRPMFVQPDGTKVSRLGITVESDGLFYEIPSVDPIHGRIMEKDEAFQVAMRTGEYMVFGTQEEADTYSQMKSAYLSTGQDVFATPVPNPRTDEEILADEREDLDNQTKANNRAFIRQLFMSETGKDVEARFEEEQFGIGGANTRRAMLDSASFIDKNILAPAQLALNAIGADETANDLSEYRDAVNGDIEFDRWQGQRVEGWNDTGLFTTAVSVADFASFVTFFKARAVLSVAGTYQNSMDKSNGDVELSMGRAATEAAMYLLIHKTGNALGRRLTPGIASATGRGMASVERGVARSAGTPISPGGFSAPYKDAVKNLFKGGKPNAEAFRAVGRVMVQDMKQYGASAKQRYGPGLQDWMALSRKSLGPVLKNAIEIAGISVAASVVDELVTEVHRDQVEAMNNVVLDSYSDRVLARNSPNNLVHHFGFGLAMGAFGAARGMNRAYQSGRDRQKQYFQEQLKLDARLKTDRISAEEYFESTQLLGVQFNQFRSQTASGKILNQALYKADDPMIMQMAERLAMAAKGPDATGPALAMLRQHALRIGSELQRRGLLNTTGENISLAPPSPITVAGKSVFIPSEPGTGARRPSVFGGGRRGMMNPALLGLGGRRLSPGDKESGVSRYLDAQKAAGLKVPGLQASSMPSLAEDVTQELYGISREEYLEGLKSSAGFDITQLAPIENLPEGILTYAASQILEPIGANVIVPLNLFRKKVQGDFHNLGLIIPKGEYEDVYHVPARVQVSRATDLVDTLNEIGGGNPVQQYKALASLGIEEQYGNLILEDFFDTTNPGYGLEVRRIEEQYGITFLPKEIKQGQRETLYDEGAGPAGQKLFDELKEYLFLDTGGRLEFGLDKARAVGQTPMLGDVIGLAWIDPRAGRKKNLMGADRYARGSGKYAGTSYDRPEGLIHDSFTSTYDVSNVLNTNTAVVGSEFTMYQGRASVTILSGKRGLLQIGRMKPVTVLLEDFIPVDAIMGEAQLTLKPDETADLVGNIMARADVETNPKFKKSLEEFAAQVANLGYRPSGGFEPPKDLNTALYYMSKGLTVKEPYFETVDGKRVKKFRDIEIDATYIRDNFYTIKPSESTESSVLREVQSAKKRTPKEQKQYDDLTRLLRAQAKGARAAVVGMVPRQTMQDKVKAVKDKLKQGLADLKYDRDLGLEGQRHIVRYIKGQKDLPKSVREEIIGRVNVAGKLGVEELTKLLDKAEVEIHTVIMNQEFKNLSAQLSLARKASTSNPTSGYALLPGNRQELETVLNIYGEQPITLDPVSNASRLRATEIVANVTEPSIVANAQIVLDTPQGSIGQFYPGKDQLKKLEVLDAAHDTARQLREAIQAVLEANNATQEALAVGRIKDRVEIQVNTDMHVRAGNSSGVLQGKQRVGREMVDKETVSLTQGGEQMTGANMLNLEQQLEVFTVNGLAYTEGFAQIYARDNEFKLVENHNKQHFDNLLLDNGVSPGLQKNYGEAFNQGNRVPDQFRETVSDGDTSVSLSSDELVFYASTLRSTRAVDLYEKGKFDIGPSVAGGKSQTININKEFIEAVDEALNTLSAKTGFNLRAIVDGFVDAFNNPESPLVKLTKRGLIQDHNRSFVQSENGTYMPFAYRTQGGAELLGPEDVIGFKESEIKEQLQGSMIPTKVFDGMESRAVLAAQADSKRAIATVGAFYFYARRAQAQAAQFSVNNALGNLHKVFSDPMVVSAYSENGLSDSHSNILTLIENVAKFRSGHGTKFRGDEKLMQLLVNRMAAMTLGFNLPVAVGQSASLEMYNLEGLEKAYHVSDKREFLRNFDVSKPSSSFNTASQAFLQLIAGGTSKVTPGKLKSFLENHTMPTIREQIPKSRLPIFDYLMERSQIFKSTASNESGIQIYSGQTAVEMGSGSSMARMLEDLAFAMIQGKDIQTRTAGGEAFFNQFMDRLDTMLSKVKLTEDGMELGGSEVFKDVFGHDLTNAIFAEVRGHVALKLKIQNPTRAEIQEYVRNHRFEIARLESLSQVIISHFDRATTRSQPNFDLLYVNQFGQKTRQNFLAKIMYPYRGYLNVHGGQIVMSALQSRAAKGMEKFGVQLTIEWGKFVDDYVDKKRKQHEKSEEGLGDEAKTKFDEAGARADAENSARMGDGPSAANQGKKRRAYLKSYLTGMRYLLYYDIIKSLMDPTGTAEDLIEIFNDPEKRKDWVLKKLVRYSALPILNVGTSVFPAAGLLNDLAVMGSRELGMPLGGYESKTVISAMVQRSTRRLGSVRRELTADEFKFHQLAIETVMFGFEFGGLLLPGVAPIAGAGRQIEKMIPEEKKEKTSGTGKRRRSSRRRTRRRYATD